MRKIKFRAWDEENKNMFDVARYDFADNSVYHHLFADGWHLGEDLVVMQYTGLKDKNGVEIYEGDIVANGLTGAVGYIKFLQQEMGYVVVYENHDERLGHRNTGTAYEFDQRLKRIGNIYENPELIQ